MLGPRRAGAEFARFWSDCRAERATKKCNWCSNRAQPAECRGENGLVSAICRCRASRAARPRKSPASGIQFSSDRPVGGAVGDAVDLCPGRNRARCRWISPPAVPAPQPPKPTAAAAIELSGLWLMLVLALVLACSVVQQRDGRRATKSATTFFASSWHDDNIKEVEFIDRHQSIGKFTTPPNDRRAPRPADGKDAESVEETAAARLSGRDSVPWSARTWTRSCAPRAWRSRPSEPPTARACCWWPTWSARC